MYFTYSVIYYNSYTDKYFEEHGIVPAASFKEAYDKIESDYGKSVVEVHLVQYDNDDADTINKEDLLIALDEITPLSTEKYDV